MGGFFFDGFPISNSTHEVWVGVIFHDPCFTYMKTIKKQPDHMGVSKNRGTPKLSIFIGFSIINHPFWGFYLYFWVDTHIFLEYFENLIFDESFDDRKLSENWCQASSLPRGQAKPKGGDMESIPPKFNSSPLKNGGWNTFSFPFGAQHIFRGELLVFGWVPFLP